MAPALLAILLCQASDQAKTPEAKAVAFLSREVPRWSPRNRCFSCHNNGDAARALFTAARMSYQLPEKTLTDTNRWLANPARWDKNGGDGPFNDRKLARIQFAAALTDAVRTKHIKDREPLVKAAELLVPLQDKNGSWPIDGGAIIGSPATYGPFLATYFSRRTLIEADPKRFRDQIENATTWLLRTKVKSVMDAAAVILALDDNRSPQAKKQRIRCLELIRKGQGKAGGWGPFVSSPSESFDTALVMLALCRSSDKDLQEMVRRGRKYLISQQKTDGSFPATTRPTGADSYAQRISTTGWATLALLATRGIGEE